MSYRKSVKKALIALMVISCLSISGMTLIGKLINPTAAAAPKPMYKGLLWEISGNGLKTPSYLYGTMHVSDKVAFKLTDSFFICLKKSQAIALESDPSTWQENFDELDNAQAQKEISFSTNDPSNFYSNAFALRSFDKKSLGKILMNNPEVVNNLLYRSKRGNQDFEESTYLDLFIYQAARKLNKQVYGLEDFLQTEIWFKVDAEREPEMTKEQLKREKDKARAMEKRIANEYGKNDWLEEGYRLGNLDLLDSISFINDPGGMARKYQLYIRNEAMVKKMDSLMKTQSLFVGVGAAHLPGPNGMIELLRKLGYQVRAVDFKSTETAVERQEIEKLKVPVSMKTYYVPDSAFSYMAPGNMIQTNSGFGKSEYLFSDMSNGTSYWAVRLNYYGPLFGKTAEYTLKQVDSTLFESIPGEIINKKSIITANGWQGIDITNKTRRGDIQRYQIIAGNQELFIFKVSGRLTYVDGPEANNFFKSIKFATKKTGFSTYTLPSLSFNLEMPNERVYSKRFFPTQINQQAITTGISDNNHYYLAIQSGLIEYNTFEEDSFELNFTTYKFAKEISATIVNGTVGSYKGMPYCDYTLIKGKQTFFARTLINGNYFILLCTTDSSRKDAFFNSLASKKFTYTQKFEPFTDSLRGFTVNMQLNPSPFKSIIYNNRIDYFKNYDSKKKELEKLYENKSFISYYSCLETGERIKVKVYKFGCFENQVSYKEILDGFEKSNITYYGKPLNILGLDNDSSRTFIMINPISKRATLCRSMISGNSVYHLMASVDSTLEISEFVRNFFVSFTPKPSPVPFSTFEDNLESRFFNQIYSKDTTLRKQAENAFTRATKCFRNSHLPLIKTMAENPEFEKLSHSQKSSFFYNVSCINTPEARAYVEDVWKKYYDSTFLHEPILSGLVRGDNPEGRKLFLKLTSKGFITDNSNYSMFSTSTDSISEMKDMFPAILKNKFSDGGYNEVIWLLNELIETKKISPSEYKAGVKPLTNYLNDLIESISEEEITIDPKKPFSDFNSFDEFSGELNEILSSEARPAEMIIKALGPFMSDKKIKKVLDSIITLNDPISKYYLAAAAANQGYVLPDTFWTAGLKNLTTRAIAYSAINQFHLDIKNMPISDVDIYKYMAFENKVNYLEDSIELIEKVQINSSKFKGTVYLFKSLNKESFSWRIGMIAIEDTEGNDSIVYGKHHVVKIDNQLSFDEEEDYLKERIKLLDQIRTLNRPRYKSDFSSFFNINSLLGIQND